MSSLAQIARKYSSVAPLILRVLIWECQTLRYLSLSLISLLVGCSNLYYPEPKGVVVINVVDDVSKWCGDAQACAYLGRPCTVYISKRPTDNQILHEVSHCWGRRDAPK